MKLFHRALIVFCTFLYSNSIKAQENLTIPYYSNEHLKYELRMGSIVLGEAEIMFRASASGCGSYIKATARSVGLAKFVKDIEYSFYTCFDPTTGLPSVAGRIIVESDFTDNNTVDYFHDVRKDSALIYSQNTDTMAVPKGIFDILSGFYTFRANYLDNNMSDYKTTTITTFFIDEIWNLILRYRGTETVSSVLGEKRCYKIMPKTEISRYFRTHDDMAIWFTREEHVPVKIYVKMRLGSLTAHLVDYNPPLISEK